MVNQKLSQDVFEEFESYFQWHQQAKKELNALGNLSENKISEIFDKYFKEFTLRSESLSIKVAQLNTEEDKEFLSYIEKSGIKELIYDAPLFYQIIAKPRGYAGDSDVMKFMYEDKFEGENNFGKVWHKIASSVITADTVRYRKRLIEEEFFNKINDGALILNLAAGPAIEIKNYLSKKPDKKVKFIALDHDIETIRRSKAGFLDDRLDYWVANAFKLLKKDRTVLKPYSLMEKSSNPKKDTKGLNKIKIPFKYRVKKLKDGQFDFIYSAGLYDYIQTYEDKNKGSIALTRELFSLLKSGGTLLIGNFGDNAPEWIKWHMKYICEWELIYRNEEEIRVFTTDIPQDEIAMIKVISEKTGINKFLIIKKK